VQSTEYEYVVHSYSLVRFALSEARSWLSFGLLPNRVWAGRSAGLSCQTMCEVQCTGRDVCLHMSQSTLAQKTVSRPRCGWITFVRQGGGGASKRCSATYLNRAPGWLGIGRKGRDNKRTHAKSARPPKHHQRLRRHKATTFSDFAWFLLGGFRLGLLQALGTEAKARIREVRAISLRPGIRRCFFDAFLLSLRSVDLGASQLRHLEVQVRR
jgi:hypothetical protein